MKWRNFVLVTGVLVFVLNSPAASQDWVDIKSSKELRALHSNNTFKRTFMGVPVVEHYRTDGKGILISADLRMPCTWEVKGNDQVCISDERGNFCWKYQHSKKNPEEYVRRNPEGLMQVLKVEEGIPDF
jgi:hypothetical protein